MIVRRITKEENGETIASLALSDQEAAYLISFALNGLVAQGLATIVDITREEFEAQLKAEEAPSEVPQPVVPETVVDAESITNENPPS